MSKDRADARSLSKAAQEERRRIAFQMYDDGHPMTVIARALHMSYGWICKIVTNRKQHGMDAAITGGTRGRPVGSNRLLTPKQEEGRSIKVCLCNSRFGGIWMQKWGSCVKI